MVPKKKNIDILDKEYIFLLNKSLIAITKSSGTIKKDDMPKVINIK